MIEEKKSNDIVYELVDIEGLSRCLAEESWSHETKRVPEEDLYDLVVSPVEDRQVKMIREPKSHWANLFFSIKNNYESLIRTFVKK